MMLGGCITIEVADLFKGVQYAGGLLEDSPVTVWRREICEEFDRATLSNFLSFLTGCPKLPIDGLNPPLLLTKQADGQDNYLPVSHTCFNQLVLHEYSSKDILKTRIEYALKNSAEAFYMS